MNAHDFFTRYGGWLLAGFSSIGVVTTSVLVADETPKAQVALSAKRQEKGEDLTFWEKFKVITPAYAPALISGGLTIGSIFGNQALNSRQQTALMAAGAAGSVVMTEYDKYRRAIRAEQGEAVDQRAYERAKLTEEELRKEIARLKEENGPFLYCFASLPGMIFEGYPKDLLDAFMHFNRNLIIGSENTLHELYTFIGISECYYDPDEAKRYGWNQFANSVEYESYYCDFDIDIVHTQNGTPVRLVTMPIAPYDLNVNYEDESTSNHFYPLYDSQRAKEYITGRFQVCEDDIIKIEHPEIWRTGLI